MSKRYIYVLYSAVVFVIFLFSVQKRAFFFGKTSLWHHQYLTGSTVKFTGNWYREGFFHLKGAMVENPASIEFGDDLKNRTPYVSYGTGSQLPVYWLAKMLNRPPDIRLVQYWNLFNQLVIAWLLGIIVLMLMPAAGPRIWPWLLAMVAAGIYLLSPHTMYWHFGVYFSDQAVMLWLCLLVFLEVLIQKYPAKKYLWWIQSGIIFYGVFTDWLIVFVALTLFMKRLLFSPFEFRYTIRQGFFILLPALLAGILVFAHAAWLGAWQNLVERGAERVSGKQPEFTKSMDFFTRYWKGYIGEPDCYILIGTLILLVILAIYLVQKKTRLPHSISISLWLFAAFLLHTYVLKNHASEHDFSALKWQFLLALSPFVLLPVALASLLQNQRILQRLVQFGMPVLGIAWLVLSYPKVLSGFPKPELDGEEVAIWLRANTRYSDVVFSPNFEIPENPPQLLSLSHKRVYRANSLEQVKQMAEEKRLPDNANIVVFIYKGTGDVINEDARTIRHLTRVSPQVEMLKLEMPEFRKLCSDSADLQRPFLR